MGGPGSGKRPDLHRQWEILRLRAQGLSIVDIARHLGVTRQAISNCYRRLGLHFKPFPHGLDSDYLPPFTYDQILRWARVYHARHGRYPTACSEAISGAPGETWSRVDRALRRGLRGLPGGSSLLRLLRARLQEAPPPSPPPKNSRLTVKQILHWADLHYSRMGIWPRWNSGPVLDAPGELWRKIDFALIRGTRGLPGGSSLLQLLKSNGRVVQRCNGWNSEEDTLVGTLPDDQIAKRIGRTLMAVAARRRQLGIPIPPNPTRQACVRKLMSKQGARNALFSGAFAESRSAEPRANALVYDR